VTHNKSDKQQWRPKYASNAVAILVQDDCGWSSLGDICCSATFVCPHVAHGSDCWTFDPPAERREETQRFVQEYADQKTGCDCGLEPTDLDSGYLDGVNTITVQLLPDARLPQGRPCQCHKYFPGSVKRGSDGVISCRSESESNRSARASQA
jgi:hypothetical protein